MDPGRKGAPALNLLVILGVFTLLVAALYVLGLWQQKIAELQKARVVSVLRDAGEGPASKPIAQHPQIDEQACIGCGSCIAACPEDEVLGMVDGIARIVHGSRCIGHGRCAEVCPVEAVKIGLGDISLRPDIPVLAESLESSVPGVYIAGELGGMALIRNAVGQGARAISAIAARSRASSGAAAREKVIDVLIVGAGPAGLAASLKAVERGLAYVTIDQDDIGGTVRKYPRRKLTLTGRLEMPLHGTVTKEEFLKEELIEFWEELISRYRLDIRSGVRLLGLKRRDGFHLAQTSKGVVPTRNVVLALGRRGTPRKLGVSGEESEKVLYQLIDATTYVNEHVLIVGGGDSAIEAATALASQPGNAVTISYRREDFFRLKSRNRERIAEYQRDGKVRVIFNSRLQKVDADTVTLSCEKDGVERLGQLRNDYVFIFAGGDPPYPFLKQMGIQFGGSSPELSSSRSA